MTPSAITNPLRPGPARIGIVFNAFSGRNRKNTVRLRTLLGGLAGAEFREVSELDQMQSALDDLLSSGIDLLAIAGGDGMVQEVIRYLLNNRAIAEWPLLTIIPGGTTNMTASDLGIKGSPEAVIRRLEAQLRDSGQLQLVRRPALRVEEPGKAVNYGMFFGAGLIARGVKYSRSRIKQLGVTGGIFSAIIALRCLGGFLFGGGKGEWQPAKLSLAHGGEQALQGSYLFAFASTLETLIFDSRPYWGDEQAPIHVTMVAQHPEFSWWSFLRILRGKGKEIAGRGIYTSHNYQAFDLALDDEYIIDGELYRIDGETGVLHISVTDNLTFLVP